MKDLNRNEVEDWYTQYGPALLAYAVALTGEKGAAEDVLHQVFLKLLEMDQPRPNDPKPYLFRAVRNRAFNVRRSASRNVPLDADQWLDAPTDLVDAGLALQAALRELPEEQREIIVMRIWGEMTLEQAAAVLEVPTNTAASRYRYGLAKLRNAMQSMKECHEPTSRG
ncbi:MAG TPA: RNA polymerase sigma factor [Candidatus Angelobacter sp.]|nr:RNA polymerase sigma factor [Candidatus Angelobacter sp.]